MTIAIAEDPAVLRKRRMQLRSMQRSSDSLSSKRSREEDDDEDSGDEDYDDSDSTHRQRPSIRGIKRQARYEPGVKMTREELASWRKEARRIRNRESAAASRRKTKERIDSLEQELSEIQAKYKAALDRIVELETRQSCSSSLFVPNRLRQDLIEQKPSIISPSTSTTSSPLHPSVTHSVSTIKLEPDTEDLLLPECPLPLSISRPTAVSKTMTWVEDNSSCTGTATTSTDSESGNGSSSSDEYEDEEEERDTSLDEMLFKVEEHFNVDEEDHELGAFLMETFGAEHSPEESQILEFDCSNMFSI